MRSDLGLVIGLLPVALALLLLLRRQPPSRLGQAAAFLGCVFPLAFLFVANPAFRIYSRHCLLHTSMMYQIRNGIPPTSPLMAGEPLTYHWGYDGVGALVNGIFGLAPSWSFAAINLGSLIIVLVVLARVSADLVGTPARGLLGPIVGIFAITPISLWWIKDIGLVSGYVGPLMARATPVFQKFANTIGVPLGLVCLALAVLAMRLSGEKGMVRRAGLAGAVAACGVLYPPLLPGLLVTVAAFSMVEAWLTWSGDWAPCVRLVALDAAASVVGLVGMAVSLVLLGMRGKTGLTLLDTRYLAADLASVVLTVVPITVVIVVSWGRLRERSGGALIPQLLVASAANAGFFLVLSLSDRNEYKFLIVCQLLLGLVGGAAMLALRDRFGLMVAGTIAFAFLGSFVHLYANCIEVHRTVKAPLVEIGGRLVHPNPEQAELYSWVGAQTPSNSAFVDSEHLVTVLGPRAVLAPYWSVREKGQLERERGFIHRMDLFPAKIQGVDPKIVTKRRRLVQALLDGGKDEERIPHLLEKVGVTPVFVVCRRPEQRHRLAGLGAEEVFRTTEGNVSVVRLSPRRNELP